MRPLGLARSAVLAIQNGLEIFPKQVCLISGAPRSGTTALCEWLSHQDEISVFNESRILVSVHSFMQEISRFRNLEFESPRIIELARHLVLHHYSGSRILLRKRLIVDKEPLEPIAFPSKDYEQFTLNVKKLLPDLKLLLAIRHPIATVWSMSQRTWGSSLTTMENRRFALEEYVDNWCSCADLILQYSSDPSTYVVQFGRLVKDPENESTRIFRFLKIRGGDLFQPRPTSASGFSKDERKKILLMARSRLELLSSHGISDLW